jgi:hypothetical protein
MARNYEIITVMTNTAIETETTWLTSKETALAMGMTPVALAQTRHRGTGPPFYSWGHKGIRYKAADVDAYIRERKFRSTKDRRGVAAAAANSHGSLGLQI